MISFGQGKTIARETGIRYEEPAFPGEPHVFDEDTMDSESCWITHAFYLGESPKQWLAEKQQRFVVQEEEYECC